MFTSGNGSRSGPDQLCGVHFKRGKDPDHQAGQDRGHQDIAPRILRFLRESRNTVETDIGQDRDGRATEQATEGNVSGDRRKAA